jgi:hypothetical protein
MSQNPCDFRDRVQPPYLPFNKPVSLPRDARMPDPFLFDRGTAQFAPATTSWPINMPRVAPMTYQPGWLTIQQPWAQFEMAYMAPCNVWSQHEVPPRPDGNMYGNPEIEAKTAGVSNFVLAAAALAIGVTILSSVLTPDAAK